MEKRGVSEEVVGCVRVRVRACVCVRGGVYEEDNDGKSERVGVW